MRVSTKRVLSIGIAVILFMAAFIIYIFLIRPEFESVNVKRAVVASKADLYENQDRTVSQVSKLIEEFKNIERLEENIGLAMPEGEETVQALRQIESMASQAAVTITSLDFRVSLPRSADRPFVKKLGTLEISMNLSGEYANLKQFLHYVETSIRLADVTEFAFKPAGPHGTSDALSLKVNMYYQK
jgi:Tfp pilus assembly protein PilO